MSAMIQNYINGNISTARKLAKRLSEISIFDALRDDYGFSEEKARLTARHIKTGEGWQQACDAD